MEMDKMSLIIYNNGGFYFQTIAVKTKHIYNLSENGCR